MKTKSLLVTYAITALALGACSSVGSKPASSGASAPSTPSAASSAVPGALKTETPEKSGPKRDTVTIAWGGDTHFERQLQPLLKPNSKLQDMKSKFEAADLAIVNLETAVAVGGTPEKKRYVFQAPPSALDALKSVGVDAVSSANNHAADYGKAGLEQTLKAKESGVLPMAGIGRDANQAYAPVTLEAGGRKIALITATQVYDETLTNFSAGPTKAGVANSAYPETLKRVADSVREARKTHDAVTVYIHSGKEGSNCPDERTVATSNAMVAAGAHAVINAHAHRVNGYGWAPNGAFVHYGLGNFIWYNTSADSAVSGLLTITLKFDGDGKVTVPDAKWQHLLINGDGVPREATGATQKRMETLFEGAQKCAKISHSPIVPAGGIQPKG